MDGRCGRGGRWGRSAAVLSLGAAVAVFSGCRRDAPPPDEVVTAIEAPLRTLSVSLAVPAGTGWNAEVPIRATVHNGTAATVEGVRLHLFIQFPLDALSGPDGGPPPGVVASGEGTHLAFPVDGIPEGASVSATQPVRTPPAGEAGAGPGGGRFVVRAWLTVGGERVGDEAVDTLRIAPGAERVAGGCAAATDVAVTRHGIGPVRLGMTAPALRALCPEARDTSWSAEGTAEHGLRVTVGGERVTAVLHRDTVQRIVVAGTGVRTAAGLGVGDTMGELRGRYGRACAATGVGEVVAWFPNAPGVSFALDVEPPVDGAHEVPDDARVASLWVRAGTDDCPEGPGRRGER